MGVRRLGDNGLTITWSSQAGVADRLQAFAVWRWRAVWQRLLSISHGVATVCFSTRSCLLRAMCLSVEWFRSRREAKGCSARRCASGQAHRQGAVDLDLDASVADGQHSQRSVRTG